MIDAGVEIGNVGRQHEVHGLGLGERRSLIRAPTKIGGEERALLRVQIQAVRKHHLSVSGDPRGLDFLCDLQYKGEEIRVPDRVDLGSRTEARVSDASETLDKEYRIISDTPVEVPVDIFQDLKDGFRSVIEPVVLQREWEHVRVPSYGYVSDGQFEALLLHDRHGMPP